MKKISIVIVSYNVREFLEQAILSLQKALASVSHEIFVVDNASADGTVEFLESKFSDINIIANAENVGFGKANNQAFQQCTGDYICIINPDTLVQEDTFTTLIEFLEHHPKTGMVGCKILNPDGSLQLACRRSYPTPWVAFTKMAGFANLFPKSKLFGRYNLTFLDPEKIEKVEAISGSFMLVRREIIEKIGGFDEIFFMYGEDLDLCFRINEAGWDIQYVPTTQIIHFKGESSKKNPLVQRRHFYEAMQIFVSKHFGKGKALVPSWFLIAAIYVRAFLDVASTLFKYLLWPLTDFVFLTFSIFLAIWMRFPVEPPWHSFIIVHAMYSIIWLASLAGHGLYHKWKLSGLKSASAIIVGLMANSALTFFLNQFGFSRLVVLYAGLLNLILIPGWRFLIKTLLYQKSAVFTNIFSLQKRTVLVGDENSTKALAEKLSNRTKSTNQLIGIILNTNKLESSKIAGLPVLGFVEHLSELVQQEKIQEIIFSTDKIPYTQILTIISETQGMDVSFKLVPSEMDVMIGKASIDQIDDVPFINLDYKYHHAFNKSQKRFFDILLGDLILVFTFPAYFYFRFVRKLELEEVMWSVGKNAKKSKRFKTIKSKFWREYPFLFTILSGEMSFVGREFGQEQSVLGKMIKPGWLTISRLSSLQNQTAEQQEKLLLYYLKNHSLLLDIKIILNTKS